MLCKINSYYYYYYYYYYYLTAKPRTQHTNRQTLTFNDNLLIGTMKSSDYSIIHYWNNNN